MGLTVISYGRFYVALYLFEKLLLHDENDSFVFLFSYASLKFRVYIYTDYTYMVALASKQLFDDPVWVEHYERCVELFIERFIVFCRYTINKNSVYNREKDIGHYVLLTFSAHFIDWRIWYAFFLLPYRMIIVFNDGKDGHILALDKTAHCDG